MDEQLIEALGVATKTELAKKGRGTHIRFGETGEIEIEKTEGPVRYQLKPIRELFSAGADSPIVDPEDEKYMPLFLGIETEIARYYEDENSGLTDGAVGLTLDQLAMDLSNPPATDVLAQRIAMGLRLTWLVPLLGRIVPQVRILL